MSDSDAAVKLLWQATDIDPTDEDAYVYLGLYYNSRSDFDNVVKVYQKLVKYQPNQVSAYLNIGEAYMSFSPPKTDDALVYYRKAYEFDPEELVRGAEDWRSARAKRSARRRAEVPEGRAGRQREKSHRLGGSGENSQADGRVVASAIRGSRS